MFNELTEFDRKLLPKKLKIVDDLKMLGIKNPDDIDFVLLTDAQELEKEYLKLSGIYLIINKANNRSNGVHTLIKDLKKYNFKIELNARTDSGQIQSLREEYEKNKVEEKDSAETNSVEHEKLRNFFNDILKQAYLDKVSDIHIEKRKSDACIKMRMNGELRKVYKNQPTIMIENLCRIIYNIFAEKEGKEVNFSDKEIQQAAINTNVSDEEVKLRYQSIPTYPEGFDIILRLLPLGKDDQKIIPLTTLGFEVSQEKELKNIVSKPVGALIIAGTTGSGKSTTLKNLLMNVNMARDYKCKIYTIEDPPEYKIPHVSQIPVTRRKGQEKVNPFEAPLVATMRGDPDLIMIGEIRDGLTGDGLKKATQSGHQVMTTVHATSSIGIVGRLTDFGISASVMSSSEFLNGLVYQKLLPIICPHCSLDFNTLVESASSGEDVLELQLRIDDLFDNVEGKDKVTIKIRNNEGCEHCKYTGVSGRTVCAEIVAPDFEMLNYFKFQDSTGALKYWLKTSDDNILSSNMKGKTCQEHAILKMTKGLVSPFDIESAFGPINATKLNRMQLSEKKDDVDFAKVLKYFSVSEESRTKAMKSVINERASDQLNDEEGDNIFDGLRDSVLNWENDD